MPQARRFFSCVISLLLFCTLSSTALADTPESQILGVATDFTVFVSGDYTASSGSINGRIAAGGNINLNSYSVGGQVVQGDSPEALLAGGNIHFPDGSVSQGNIIAAGSISGVGSNVTNALSGNQQLLGGQTLRFNFPEEFQKLTALSNNLSQLNANGSVSEQWGSVLLEGDCVSNTQVFNLDGTLLNNANTLNVNCIPANASVIVNVAGVATGFTNMGIGGLGANGKVLFNLYEASNVSITGVSISAGILAPLANVEAANGHVNGFVVASAWNGAVSLEYTAFNGTLPSITTSSSSSSSSVQISSSSSSSVSSQSSSASSIVVSSSSLSSMSSSSVISSSSSSSVVPVDFTITTEASLGGSVTPENFVVTGGEVIALDVVADLGSKLFSIVGCGGSYEASTHIYYR